MLMKQVATVADGPMGDGKKDRYPSQNRLAFAFQAALCAIYTPRSCRCASCTSAHFMLLLLLLLHSASAPLHTCSSVPRLPISQEAHKVNSALQRRGAYNVPHTFMAVETAITQCSDLYEEFEHLHNTPIPLPYAQLVRLIALIFLLELPLSTVASLSWGVLPLSFTANIVYFLTDVCAAEMEAPFGRDANDVQVEACAPLCAYCAYTSAAPLLHLRCTSISLPLHLLCVLYVVQHQVEKMVRRIDKHTACQVFLCRYITVTLPLHYRYMTSTPRARSSYTVTSLLHYRHVTSTPRARSSYTRASL